MGDELVGAIIVHGGAWDIPDDVVAPHQAGVRAAAAAGWAVLQAGGSALDAVEAAIRLMEDDGTFDAGRGSFLNQDGVVELDAGIMAGHRLEIGAVAAVRGVPHPITLARRILEHSHFSMLAGAGAQAYARACGLQVLPDAELIHPREQARWAELRADPAFSPDAAFTTGLPSDTVGAVALDRAGQIVAGTSTGGTPYKHPGRVGDSPIVGAGFYADRHGGASSTGHGEAILRVGLARAAVEALAGAASSAPTNNPQAAADAALARLAALPGHGGLILLDAQGRSGIAFNTPRMAYALVTPDGDLRVGI
jgi:beta-aspartyl-peptidase (threonine type)